MKKSVVTVTCVVVFLCLLNNITCPPVTERPPAPSEEEQKEAEEATNLEYNRYLREIVSVLESDQAFKKKLEESNISEIKSGEIAKHLDFVSHGIRTQLDEIKRREIDRLRQVMRLKAHLQNGMRRTNPNVVLSPLDRDRIMGHLDHNNPDTFEVDDLAKLIKKATSDLEEVDRKRREEFKRYEMEKEHLRKKELEQVDPGKREEAEKQHVEQEKKHADHPKLHHPGNEAQLKEVWEESDGLNEQDFDPRTFFSLHDSNGDGVLDEAEVEALFQNELDKAYDPNAPEDDMMERYEEMNRMREHVMNEIDQNKDKLISLEEFIINTKSKEFKKDDAWETLDNEQIYSEEDFKEFERLYEERERQKQGGNIPQQPVGGDHLGGGHQGAGDVNVMHQQQQQQQQHQEQQQQQHESVDYQQQQQQQQFDQQQVQEVQQQVQPNVGNQEYVVHQDAAPPAEQQQEQHVAAPAEYVQQQFNAEQPVQQQFNAEQPIQQQFNAEQPVQQQFNAEQPVQQQFNAEQPVQQQFNAEQPFQQQFNAEQPVQQQFNAEQPAQQQFNAEQQQPVAFQQAVDQVQPVVDLQQQQHVAQPAEQIQQVVDLHQEQPVAQQGLQDPVAVQSIV